MTQRRAPSEHRSHAGWTKQNWSKAKKSKLENSPTPAPKLFHHTSLCLKEIRPFWVDLVFNPSKRGTPWITQLTWLRKSPSFIYLATLILEMRIRTWIGQPSCTEEGVKPWLGYTSSNTTPKAHSDTTIAVSQLIITQLTHCFFLECSCPLDGLDQPHSPLKPPLLGPKGSVPSLPSFYL